MKKPRISAKSVPIVMTMDRHIRDCNIRGNLDRFSGAAADPCDGLYYMRELRDLIRRGMLFVVPYDQDGYDIGPDLGDGGLCGKHRSVNPTEKMIRTFWSDRLRG